MSFLSIFKFHYYQDKIEEEDRTKIDLEGLNETPQYSETPVETTLARGKRALVAHNAG